MAEEIIPIMPPFAELPEAVQALGKESYRKFAWAYVFNGANGAAAARVAGYSDHLEAAKVRAHWLLQRDDIGAAIEGLSRRYLFSLAPKAVLKLNDLLDDKDHPKHDKAIAMVLDRTAPVKTQVDVNLNGSVTVNHTDAAIEDLRRLTALGVPEAELERVFGYSGLGRYRRMLAAADAKLIEHRPGGEDA
jgi:hypothetical protein